MQGWFVAVVAAAGCRRAAPGGHVFDTRTTLWLAFDWWPAGGLLQTADGVGGMVMAGALLLVLGLAAVAVWQGLATLVWDRLVADGTSAEHGPADPADGAAEPGTAETESTGQGVVSEPAELTDKEVIVDILEDNDGRMKQARIVDATGWSKSKVSMLLSEMEDDGDITKLRVGRENIISLSGNEPDAAGSPFDSG